MPSGDCYVASESGGLLEMRVNLGAAVRKGEVLARVHSHERTGAAPIEYRAKLDGILAGRHFPGLLQIGDTIAVVAVPTG
jgi:N-alpha-acetyl-L-2,4-diaminobutyrate deacetylase